MQDQSIELKWKALLFLLGPEPRYMTLGIWDYLPRGTLSSCQMQTRQSIFSNRPLVKLRRQFRWLIYCRQSCLVISGPVELSKSP